MNPICATPIVCGRRDQAVVMGGDGQVTMGQVVVKHTARKVRKLYRDRILAGFAGTAADAFTLFERFEGKLEQWGGNLLKASVELSKDWRSDRALRRLEALLAVADRETSLILSGTGEVIEPDDPVIAIGSGGDFARAAALALMGREGLDAEAVVRESLAVASRLCIYTNDCVSVERL